MKKNQPPTRRQFIKTTATLTGASLAPVNLLAQLTEKISEKKPNVVIMFIDDLGYADIGPYGAKDIPTPHLDRLAKEGVVCTSSYITNPPCCPSRCSLMMGMYAQHFGKYGMSRRLPIPADKQTLAEFMRDSGYVTGQIGKWDIGSPTQGPSARGFMEVAKKPPLKMYEDMTQVPKRLKNKGGRSKYIAINKDGSEQWLTDLNGDMMVEFIERNKEKPFFMYFSPEAVHSWNSEVPPRLENRSTAKGVRRKLAGAIISVDDQVGKLLQTLEKHNLRKDTLIIFTSDNGPNLTEGGSAAPYAGGKGNGTQKEGWVRVPTIFSYPGKIPEGKTYKGLTCTLDYYATIAALIGTELPNHCDGVNIIPYLKKEKKGDAHEFLYWLNNDPDDPKHRHLKAVRWKNWRLYYHKKDGWQLFDLKSDPGEEKDVAKKNRDVFKNMKKHYEKWLKTLSPLLKMPAAQKGKTPPIVPTGHGWVMTKG